MLMQVRSGPNALARAARCKFTELLISLIAAIWQRLGWAPVPLRKGWRRLRYIEES